MIFSTRRKMLKVLPVAAASVAVPAATLRVTADRLEWEKLLQSLHRALDKAKAHDPVWEECHERWIAGQPSMETIHWREFPFEHRDYAARSMDLAERWERFLKGEGKAWWSNGPDGAEAKKRRYRAALDSVQAFRDAEGCNDRESGMDEANDQADRYANEIRDHFIALMAMPSPDLAALRWKLDHITEEARTKDGNLPAYTNDYVAQMLDDFDRLLPGAA